MKHEIITKIMATIMSKLGYIAIGIFIAAIVEYGMNFTTIFGTIISAALITAAHLEYKYGSKEEEDN